MLKGGVIDKKTTRHACSMLGLSQVRPPFARHSIQVLFCMSMQFIWGNQVHACTRPFFAPLETLREIKQELHVDHWSGLLIRYFATFSHSVTYLSSRFVPAVVATINANMASTNNLGFFLCICDHPFETYLIHCISCSVIQQSFYQHKHSCLLAYSPFLVCCSSNRIHT